MEKTQSTNAPCRLCGAACRDWAASSRGEHYLYCPACSCIQRPTAELPGPEAERDRYREHNNQPDNPDYLGYLNRFVDSAIDPRLRPPAHLLDFGCGPGAVLSQLLRERGYHVQSYDPFFAPDPGVLDPVTQRYDGIILLEVIEHLHQPGAELARLCSLLKPHGTLVIRTGLFDALPPSDPAAPRRFLRWWYQRDPTHVWFLTPATVDWIAQQFSLRLVHRAPGVELAFDRRVA